MTDRPLLPSPRMQSRVQLAITRRITGVAHIFSRPDVPASYQLTEGSPQMEPGVSVLEESAYIPDFRSDDRPLVENLDVWKDRIPRHGRKKWERWLKRLFELLELAHKLVGDKSLSLAARISMLKYGRELTPLELEQVKENMERRRLDSFHKERAVRAGKMMIQAMANIGLAKKRIKDGNEKITKTVRFDRVSYSPLQYTYHVDALHSPCNIADINRPDVMTHLSAAVQHPVRGDLIQAGSFVPGLKLTIEIAATLGIPNKCDFPDMLKLIPEGAPDLAFTLGYAENKRPTMKSLENLPHLLITGETLGGKSNSLNAIICCHLARNTPTTVRMLMCDVKGGGIELGHFEGIKHLINEVPGIPSGIARTPAEGLSVLEWATDESDRRMMQFTGHKIKNLDQWNRKHRKMRYPRIVVYIDELAEMMDPEDKHLRKGTMHIIRRLAATCRAAGVHIVAALQTADRGTMPQTIKNNFPGRLAFAMADASASIIAIGDGSAINLKPVGRSIWKHGTDRVMIQTPLITNQDIAQIVGNAKTGRLTQKVIKQSVEPDEIVQWSVEENNSELRFSDVFNKFRERTTKDGLIRLLKEMDGEIFLVGQHDYQVIPGAGTAARIVVRINVPNTDPSGHFSPDGTQDTSPVKEDEGDVVPCPGCGAQRKEDPCEWCGREEP